MDPKFAPILSRDTALGEVRFTATPNLVARETGIEGPTGSDIRQWLEANASAAADAAILWRLAKHGHAISDDGTSSWDGVVWLDIADFPPKK